MAGRSTPKMKDDHLFLFTRLGHLVSIAIGGGVCMSQFSVVSAAVIAILTTQVWAGTPQSDLRKIRTGKQGAAIVEKRFGWVSTPGPEQTFDYLLTEEQVTQLGQALHEENGRCGGFKDISLGEFVAPAKSFVVPKRKHALHVDLGPVNEVSEERIRKTVEKLSSWKTRFYRTETGKEASIWLKSEIERMAQEYGRSDVSAKLIDHSSERRQWVMPSVIAELKGTLDEKVVIGGHLDSVNQAMFRPTEGPAPGADDDASGVATALEAFRVILQSGAKPKRTIQLMAYSAEEVGLWGSQSIANSYGVRKENVKAVMQLDMVLYPDSNGSVYMITDHVNAQLTQYVTRLGQQLGLKMQTTECGYACSDHASWTSAGYPSVFPFETDGKNYNPKIHSPEDTLANAPWVDHAVKFGKLAVAYLWDLAVASGDSPNS
jgi:bacterial leucyl aminopeptidase